jgi:predicted ABC-type ATPase
VPTEANAREKQRAMTTKGPQPTVYVIAGPNGAGKTTFATQFLPNFVNCREFLNADLIAAGLSPFAPETQNMRAGRLLLERIRELAKARRDFGFETTLAGRMHIKLIEDLRRWGYRINLFFLWLPSADAAVRRVAQRVSEGGHAVPDDVVRRRYASGLRNFFRLYSPRVDAWWLFDSARMPPSLVAQTEHRITSAVDAELLARIRKATEDQPDE